MYIREYMITNIISADSEASIQDAEKIMRDHKIRRLPIIDKGKLVGVVTRDKLREVAPSPATSLSIWELNYLLAKTKVKDIMRRSFLPLLLILQ